MHLYRALNHKPGPCANTYTLTQLHDHKPFVAECRYTISEMVRVCPYQIWHTVPPASHDTHYHICYPLGIRHPDTVQYIT